MDSRCKCQLWQKVAEGIGSMIRGLASVWRLLGSGMARPCTTSVREVSEEADAGVVRQHSGLPWCSAWCLMAA